MNDPLTQLFVISFGCFIVGIVFALLVGYISTIMEKRSDDAIENFRISEKLQDKYR